MKKLILCLALLLAMSAPSAMAQPPGVNLAWDGCGASFAGGLNKTSTCQSNTEGQKNANGSYVLPADADALAGNDIVMDIITNSATLPCWWNFTVAPRTSGFGMNFGTPCPEAFDYWGSVGTPAGGPGAFLMPTNAVPRIRIKAVVAIDATVAAPVPASTGEIYSYTFNLKHGATVGSCTGCSTAACFVLNLIRVTQVGFPYFELTSQSSRNFVIWQSVQPYGCFPDPVINRTWGSVKALYR